MSTSSSISDYLQVLTEHLDSVDRVIYSGRRGTGKSTGLKLWIAGGRRVIWVARSKRVAPDIPSRFVPPAVADVLPPVELLDDGVLPMFGLGDGVVRVVPITAVSEIRDTGVDVDGCQAEAIVVDELIRPDGRYVRREPELVDDLAGTVGRSGTRPVIIGACNPPDPPYTNAHPYAYTWHVNVGAEGVYQRDGYTTRVIGTAHCRSCFDGSSARLGWDPTPEAWAPHLDRGGDVVYVDGVGLRCRTVGGGLYVGLTDDPGTSLMHSGVYAPAAVSGRGSHFLAQCKQMLVEERVVYDSFDAQLTFYKLLRLRGA